MTIRLIIRCSQSKIFKQKRLRVKPSTLKFRFNQNLVQSLCNRWRATVMRFAARCRCSGWCRCQRRDPIPAAAKRSAARSSRTVSAAATTTTSSPSTFPPKSIPKSGLSGASLCFARCLKSAIELLTFWNFRCLTTFFSWSASKRKIRVCQLHRHLVLVLKSSSKASSSPSKTSHN